MSRERSSCRDIETDLVAVAAGEAAPAAVRAVDEHVAGCGRCRGELQGYRGVEAFVAGLKRPSPGPDPTLARAELQGRLRSEERRSCRERV